MLSLDQPPSEFSSSFAINPGPDSPPDSPPHVSKVVHDALDEIRRRIQRELSPADRKVIKGKRYVLLRARERLNKRDQVSLQEILDANTDLTAGYVLKEAFREVFKATNMIDGRRRLKEWKIQVRQSGVPELLQVLKTIERRKKGIENFFRYRVANGWLKASTTRSARLRRTPMAFMIENT